MATRDVSAERAVRRPTAPGSFAVGRIAGIDVEIHHTWLIAFALITWSLAAGFYPSRFEDFDAPTYWVLGAVSAIGLFASVLLHELSHSLVARAYGLRVRGITLFIFGGVSTIEDETERPGHEFLVAIVGPLTSLAIAGAMFLAAQFAPAATPAAALVGYLALVNLIVGLFNLLPGFPLDGGRVLRAGIWAATGSLRRATQVASYGGQALGFLLILAGVGQLFAGNLLGGIWIAFIGWFLSGAAEGTRREQELREELRGLPVSMLMDPTPPMAAPDLSVRDFVFDRVMRQGERAVLVVEDGRLRGIVTITDAKDLPHDQWDRSTIGQIMTPEPLRTVSPEADVATAMEQLVDGTLQQLPVVSDGRVVGLIGRADILRSIALRDELHIELSRSRRRS